MLAGVSGGSAAKSGSHSRTAAIVSEVVARWNASRPDSISYKHASEGPHVRACVRGLAARLLRAHIAEGSKDHPFLTGEGWSGQIRR